MDRCPVEIWTLIFAHACSDDGGKTYRSIALVSRYFYAASQHLRFQSLIITDSQAARRLARTLEHDTTHRHPKFRHLTLTDRHPDPDYVYGPVDALKVTIALARILYVAFPTLVSLTIDKQYFSRFPHTLIPGPLPALEELSLTNLTSLPSTYPESESEGFSAPLGSLKHLHLHFTQCTDIEWFQHNLCDHLPWIAPHLEVLHVEGMFWYPGITEFINRTIYRESQIAREHPSPNPDAPLPVLPGIAPTFTHLTSSDSRASIAATDDTETGQRRQLSMKAQRYKSQPHITSFWNRLRIILSPIPALHEYPSSYPDLSGQLGDATTHFPIYMSKTAYGFMVKLLDGIAKRDVEGRLIVIDGMQEALRKDAERRGWTGKLKNFFTPAHSRWP